jgi:hypothetical protein
MEIAGYRFEYVCQISPETGAHGRPREFMPQSRYANRDGRPLHAYGAGPFCRFSIPSTWNGSGGVYIFLADSVPRYVGCCDSLGNRINQGYGAIQPRNCFFGGQETNCRINSLVLEANNRGMRVELLFHETEWRHDLEASLIGTLSPEWNKLRPAPRSNTTARLVSSQAASSAGGQGGHQMACHEEVLDAAKAVTAAKGRNEFSPREIIEHMKAGGSPYRESTIRTHIVSRCCLNAPDHHAVVYGYFKRVGPGTYRIIE